MIFPLIMAAGQGRRMGAERPKQYMKLAGKPILAHTLACFDHCDAFSSIYLVVPEADVDYCQSDIVAPAGLTKPVTLVAGGARRQDSVLNGLHALGTTDGVVLIHDGVRPFVPTNLIDACIAGAEKYGACIPAIPVHDTLKQVDSANHVQSTVPRDGLYTVQTPQAFQLPIIIKAHAEALMNGWRATDDASLVERMAGEVRIVKGARENIKITTPEDLSFAEAWLQFRG